MAEVAPLSHTTEVVVGGAVNEREVKSCLWHCWLDGENHVYLILPKLHMKIVSQFSLEALPLVGITLKEK